MSDQKYWKNITNQFHSPPEQPFDEKAWQRLEERLEEDRKRRGIIWWRLGLLLLLPILATVGYVIWQPDSSSALIAPVVSTDPVSGAKNLAPAPQILTQEAETLNAIHVTSPEAIAPTKEYETQLETVPTFTATTAKMTSRKKVETSRSKQPITKQAAATIIVLESEQREEKASDRAQNKQEQGVLAFLTSKQTIQEPRDSIFPSTYIDPMGLYPTKTKKASKPPYALRSKIGLLYSQHYLPSMDNLEIRTQEVLLDLRVPFATHFAIRGGFGRQHKVLEEWNNRDDGIALFQRPDQIYTVADSLYNSGVNYIVIPRLYQTKVVQKSWTMELALEAFYPISERLEVQFGAGIRAAYEQYDDREYLVNIGDFLPNIVYAEEKDQLPNKKLNLDYWIFTLGMDYQLFEHWSIAAQFHARHGTRANVLKLSNQGWRAGVYYRF